MKFVISINSNTFMQFEGWEFSKCFLVEWNLSTLEFTLRLLWENTFRSGVSVLTGRLSLTSSCADSVDGCMPGIPPLPSSLVGLPSATVDISWPISSSVCLPFSLAVSRFRISVIVMDILWHFKMESELVVRETCWLVDLGMHRPGRIIVYHVPGSRVFSW